MTPTTMLTERVGTGSSELPPVPQKPSHAEVVEAIRKEATDKGVQCSIERAVKLYDMLEHALLTIRSRTNKKSPYHLTHEDLSTVHDVLEVVMVGHATKPDEGSAHDLIHHHFLEGEECALVHTIDEERGAVHCAVELRLRRSSR
jgi:hypothetical protein